MSKFEFPAFIKLEKGNGDPAKTAFLADVDSILSQANTKVSDFGAAARRNLDSAFKLGATGSGGLNLDVPGLREAAAVQAQRATVARQLADATLQAAQAEGTFSQATRLSIAAAKQLAADEQPAATAARMQADATERLQLALDQAGLATKRFNSANDNARASAGAFRAGSQQLGYQISDLGVQLGMAANSANTGKLALMAFSQQVPQIVQAISLMRGTAGGFAGFMAGPWGAALIAAGSILGTLALAHQDAAGASDVHKDAAEDLTKALDDLHNATVRESRSTQASVQVDIDKANGMRQRAVETRKAAIAQLEATKATLNATRDGLFAGQAGPAAGIAVGSYMNRAAELDAEIAKQNAQIGKADETIRLKRGAQIRQRVAEAFDPSAAAAGRYERTLDSLNASLLAGKISEGAYRAEVEKATTARNAATEAARRHDTASEGRPRKVKAEADAIGELAKAYRALVKDAEDAGKAAAAMLGKQTDKDTGKLWAGVADRQADALGKFTATANANAAWNDELAETVRLLDQIGGAGSALGDIGRILGTLSGGNLGALPGPAGILGKALGGVTWHSVDSDGNRAVHQLGDEFASVLDDVFGSRGSFSKVLESAGIGSAAGQLVLGSKGNNLGSAIGGVLGKEAGAALFKGVGGMLGKLGGPLGSIVGGVLGGALGSAFSKVSKGYAVVTNAGVTAGGSNADLTASSRTSGTGIQAALAGIAEQLGGSIGNYAVSIGKRSSGYIRVSASGSSRVADKSFAKNGGADLLYDGKDEAEAMRVALLNALQDGAVKGIREGAQRLLKAGGDIETALKKALSFEGVFRDLKAIKDPVGSVLDALNLEFRRLIDIFKEAGATTADMAQLEELYGIKRADAVRDANERILGSLKGLNEYLTVGSDFYSLRDREQSALAVYNPLKARVAAGDSTAFDAFSEAAQTLLEIERTMFGSTSAFFSRADEVRSLTDQAITGKTAISDAATASDSPFSQLASQQQATTSAIDNQTNALIAQLGGRLDALNDNTIAVWRQLVTNGASASSAATSIATRGYF